MATEWVGMLDCFAAIDGHADDDSYAWRVAVAEKAGGLRGMYFAVGVGIRGETVQELIADILAEATGDWGHGYTMRLSSLQCQCATCHGIGKVSAARARSYKVCPDCKGKAISVS